MYHHKMLTWNYSFSLIYSLWDIVVFSLHVLPFNITPLLEKVSLYKVYEVLFHIVIFYIKVVFFVRLSSPFPTPLIITLIIPRFPYTYINYDNSITAKCRNMPFLPIAVTVWYIWYPLYGDTYCPVMLLIFSLYL